MIVTFACPECSRQTDVFLHLRSELGTQTMLCACRSTMAPILSVGRGLTYFEEGRGRWIHNLGPDPVYVTSHEQHKRLMRERQVDWSTAWPVKKSGGWV